MYTIFYDQWVAGRNNIFRWENSKTFSFSYDTIHPIPGVVISALIDKDY
jgi:hypothetical protein